MDYGQKSIHWVDLLSTTSIIIKCMLLSLTMNMHMLSTCVRPTAVVAKHGVSWTPGFSAGRGAKSWKSFISEDISICAQCQDSVLYILEWTLKWQSQG